MAGAAQNLSRQSAAEAPEEDRELFFTESVPKHRHAHRLTKPIAVIHVDARAIEVTFTPEGHK